MNSVWSMKSKSTANAPVPAGMAPVRPLGVTAKATFH
jgi:hypothetical protein